jgi:hypothetical protein
VIALLLCTALIQGRVVDGQTLRPLTDVAIAVAPLSVKNEIALSGDRAPAASPNAHVVMTDENGRFEVDAPGEAYVLTAYGASAGRVTFHGVFPSGDGDVGDLRLLVPTNEERATLSRINAFRARFGVRTRLVFDENLMESARFWASEELASGHVGHTCATIGRPAGCSEFNDYFHSLRGAPVDWRAGQDAAFDSDTRWDDPESGFEDEGRLCVTPYDWHHCTRADRETGHFTNIMAAAQWIGLGKEYQAGVGAYFAMNMI